MSRQVLEQHAGDAFSVFSGNCFLFGTGMIKRNKEENPSPTFDTVVPKTKWKLDLISQQVGM